MKELRIIKYLFVITIVLSGCYYDVEEELYPNLECATSEMSYKLDILPIIKKDCYACHSAAANFGNITLEGHSKILDRVNDGSLLGAIKYSPGYSPMPKGGAQLLDCEIVKIEAWIEDGALDN